MCKYEMQTRAVHVQGQKCDMMWINDRILNHLHPMLLSNDGMWPRRHIQVVRSQPHLSNSC